jgi:DNA (cytosine-5)-methyltransferase 1
LRAIDLFCGAGGLSLGLKEAGIEIAACVDLNKDAIATHATHSPEAEHLLGDIRGQRFDRFRNAVDLVTGGPPCQPFSVGGLRRASADPRDMIPEFVRVLREVEPAAFVMENVPGLIQSSNRPYFEWALAQLVDAGYVINWTVLNSADYGVPQKRRRLFVIGARTQLLRFPAPTHGVGAPLRHVGALDALGPDPIGEAPNCPVKYAKYPDLRPSPYAGHVYNGGGRPIDPDGPCHTILASSGGYKTHWIDTHGVAPKYHAHLVAGGAPWEGEVPGARRLSVEECSIIQTFPRELLFCGSRSSQYTQVGDAVPPLLGLAVARAVRSQLEGRTDVPLLDPRPEVAEKQAELAL